MRGLRIVQTLDDPTWQARLLNSVGWFAARLGRHEHARAHCEAALALFLRHHHRQGQANTLDSLGYLTHNSGRYTQAISYFQQAITLFHDLGDSYELADTLDRLGCTHAALDHHDEARDTWHQAMLLYRKQHRLHDAKRMQQQLHELTEAGHHPQHKR